MQNKRFKNKIYCQSLSLAIVDILIHNLNSIFQLFSSSHFISININFFFYCTIWYHHQSNYLVSFWFTSIFFLVFLLLLFFLLKKYFLQKSYRTNVFETKLKYKRSRIDNRISRVRAPMSAYSIYTIYMMIRWASIPEK